MKKLGLKELVAIGVGGMIGGGIFSVLGLLLQYAGAMAPLAFSIGAVIAFLSAYSYAKLSQYHPCLGGTIEYIAMTIKNLFVLDYFNALLWVGYVVMVSLYAFTFGAYAAASMGFVEGTFMYYVVQHIMIALVLIAFMYVNIMGAHAVGEVENVLVYSKVAILLFFVIIGLLRANPQVLAHQPVRPWYMVILGGMIIFSAYEGFGIISNAGLAAKSKKDLYRAFFISVAIVAIIYISIAYVAVATMPIEEVIKYKDYALGMIAKPILGKLGFALIDFAALLSTASAINATIYGAARIAHFLPRTRKIMTKEEMEKFDPRMLKKEVIISTLIALLIAEFYHLANISLMGSLAFLLIYMMVNYTAYKLADVIGANKKIEMLAIIMTLMPAIALSAIALYVNFWSQLAALMTLLLPPFFIALGLQLWRKAFFKVIAKRLGLR